MQKRFKNFAFFIKNFNSNKNPYKDKNSLNFMIIIEDFNRNVSYPIFYALLQLIIKRLR